MAITVQNNPDVPALPEAAAPPAQPDAPAPEVAAPEDTPAEKPKAKRTRGPGKRKAKDAAAAEPKDAPAAPVEPEAPKGDDDELAPLPPDATGFRKRAKKEGYTPVQSSSIPGMSVGDVRKSLNQIRKAGEAIRSEHLLFNGWPAGKFALSFILGNHIKRKQRKDKEDGDKEKDSEEDATTAPEDGAEA